MTNTKSYAESTLARYCIAPKLRALRLRKQITLARLASETGFSTALLSKLETDRMIPTLPTLVTICRVYGVGLEHFFADADRHTISITRRRHLQAGSSGRSVPVKIPLSAPGEEQPLVPEVIEMSEGSSYVPEEHDGKACAVAYVLEGDLEMNSGGVVDTLATGDCVYLDTKMPISWTAREGECKVLVVRPGELED